MTTWSRVNLPKCHSLNGLRHDRPWQILRNGIVNVAPLQFVSILNERKEARQQTGCAQESTDLQCTRPRYRGWEEKKGNPRYNGWWHENQQRRFEESLSLHPLDPFLLYCFLVNPAALQFVSILDDQGRIHKEARQAQSDHEWIDLCLDANRNDLQAGRGRSLHDAKENESIQGNQRRLRIGSLHKYLKVWLVCETSFWNSPRP